MKHLLFLLLLFAIANSNAIVITCGGCNGAISCQSGMCQTYNGGGFSNHKVCHPYSTCSTQFPMYYYTEGCSFSSTGSQCSTSCCLRSTSFSNNNNTRCSDNFVEPNKYCASPQEAPSNSNGSTVALITVIIIVVMAFLGAIVVGFFYFLHRMKKAQKKSKKSQRKTDIQSSKDSNANISRDSNFGKSTDEIVHDIDAKTRRSARSGPSQGGSTGSNKRVKAESRSRGKKKQIKTYQIEPGDL